MVIMENEVISLNTKTCCFSGHRDLCPEKIPLLEKELNRIIADCIEKGYRRFLCGGAVGFDFLAAKTLLTYQNTCPEIQLEIVFPYRYLPPMWKKVTAKADRITYLSETYYSGCFYARNRYMVSQSHGIIYYLEKETGGTAYTVRCAINSSLERFPITLSSESEW